MTTQPLLDIRPPVAAALREGGAVVALESTLIAHGLPWPTNLETARQAEAAVRAEGAVPATIAVWQGRPTIGLDDPELEALARQTGVFKASRRDLALAVARECTAATTVAATMFLAHRAGIRIFATGGIGGAHPDPVQPWDCTLHPGRVSQAVRLRHEPPSWDISADLMELARTPVAVVCAGAKSILDIPRTLEILESYGVPVAVYGAEDFPAFYLRSSGQPGSVRVDSAVEVGRLLAAHWALDGAGVVVAQPVPADVALEPREFAEALAQAEKRAESIGGVRGPALTPFLLASLADITGGKTLRANQALIVANARLAAHVARALADIGSPVLQSSKL